jgi:hypothetical protein
MQLEYENGKLVKIDGMRPEYVDGNTLIRAVKGVAQAHQQLLRDAIEVLRQIDAGGSGGKVFDRDDCIKRLRSSVALLTGSAG